MAIIISTVIISLAVAFVLGVLLGVFQKIFYVEEDEKITKIKAALPNANCGGCGFAGCASYAEAVASGKAPANGCSAGGAAVAQAIAKILDAPIETETYVAVLACQGSKDIAVLRGNYKGVQTCAAAQIAVNGTKMCQWGCIGLGDCVSVCKFDALKLGEDGLPKVDLEKCTGCGMCVKKCPRHLLAKIPKGQKAPVALCNNRGENKPAILKDCKLSCIKCGKCEKVCESGACKVVNGIPEIDAKLCTSCGKCVEGCVRKVLAFMPAQ